MFSLGSGGPKTGNPSHESPSNTKLNSFDSRVSVPALKATPLSIQREVVARPVSDASPFAASLGIDHPSQAPINPLTPHVPHEPYKGAVWSKPVRVCGRVQSRASSLSTAQSSRASSRNYQRQRQPSDTIGGDITSTTLSTVSVLSPPKFSAEKPVSVVNPVPHHNLGVNSADQLQDALMSLEITTDMSEDPLHGLAHLETLRLEILRLREENRRLHAMRRTSSGDIPEPADESISLEKALNENQRLKEELKKVKAQLQVQAQVNQDLKKLVIASIGDDLQYRFETISSSRAQLDAEASFLLKSLGDTKEELEKMSIECDVWKSKFMASRVMVDELATWKASLHLKQTEMERALRMMVEESSSLHSLASATNRNLTQLTASLRTRYPQLAVKSDLLAKDSSESRHLLEIEKENRQLAQSLNLEIEALIKVASDRSLAAIKAASVATNMKAPNKTPPSFISLTPAAALAQEVLSTELSEPPKLSTDAIAYLDGLFGQDTSDLPKFKCCEKCKGEIKTI